MTRLTVTGETTATRMKKPRPAGQYVAGLTALPHVWSSAPAREVTRRARMVRLRFLTQGLWPLLGVLVVQAALSLRLVWSNTAFNDEALYLWSGHWEVAHLLHGVSIPQFQAYFSGAPVIYPVIGAIADSHGGLAAARLLSLAFMLGSTAACYLAGRRLFSPRAAIIAAAMFAGLGPVQFLGAFATFDPMALFLLAVSALGVVCARRWWSEPALILAGSVMALADATKYGTALWDPVVIALAVLTAGSGTWWRDGLRGLRFAAYAGVPIGMALHLANGGYVRGILYTTLERYLTTVPVVHILDESALWVGLLVAFSARAIVIAPDRRTRLVCSALVVAALLAPVGQAWIRQGTSLQKHVAFGAWFAAVAAGFVFDEALKRSRYSHWRLAAAAVAAVAITGSVEAPVLNGAWPCSRLAVAAISRAARLSPGVVLSEQGVVVDYYLHLAPRQLVNTSAFSYWDRAQGKELTGWRSYVAAIRARSFSAVEVDGQVSNRARLDHLIAEAVRTTAGYREVAAVPWRSSLGQGMFRVWRYVGGAR